MWTILYCILPLAINGNLSTTGAKNVTDKLIRSGDPFSFRHTHREQIRLKGASWRCFWHVVRNSKVMELPGRPLD